MPDNLRKRKDNLRKCAEIKILILRMMLRLDIIGSRANTILIGKVLRAAAMCCAIVAILMALFPAWTGGREAVLRWLASARHVAMAGIGAVTLIGGTAVAAGLHPDKAQHICSVLTGF